MIEATNREDCVLRVIQELDSLGYTTATIDDIQPGRLLVRVHVLQYCSGQKPEIVDAGKGVTRIMIDNEPIRRVGTGEASVKFRPVSPDWGDSLLVPIKLFTFPGPGPSEDWNEYKYFRRKTT